MSQGGANSTSGTGGAAIEDLVGNSGGAVGPNGSFIIDILGNNTTGIDVVGTPASNLLTIIGLQASTTQRGTVELATDAETISYISSSLAITPTNLTAAFASPQPIGITTPNSGNFSIVDVDNLELNGNTISSTDVSGNILLVPNGGGVVAIPSNDLYIGSATPSNPFNLTVEGSVAGLVGESIQNTLVNAAASAVIEIITEVAAGDPFIEYVINGMGGAQFSVGIDNSDSDNFKITTGTSPSGGTTAISITTAGIVTLPAGPLDVPSGGTGLATITDHAVLIGSGTGAITPVGPVASTGALLSSNGVAADPGFTTATYPLVSTINEILYSSAANTITGLATANNSVLVTDGSGVPSLGTSLSNSFTYTTATAGTTRTLTISNTDATAANYSAAQLDLITQSASTGDPFIHMNVNGGQDYAIGVDNSDSDALKINDDVNPSTGNNLWKMTSAGERTMPLQPAFLAYVDTTVTNITGTGTEYQLGNTALTEVFDQGADFNTNGTFTAPVSGRYRLKGQATYTGTTISTGGASRLNTSNRVFESFQSTSAPAFWALSTDSICDMDAADIAVFTFYVSGEAGDTVDLLGGATLYSFLSGNLEC